MPGFIDGFPSGDAGKKGIHDNEFCGFGRVHRRVGVSDHKANIVAHDLGFLKTERGHQRVDADSRRFHIQPFSGYGRVAYPWQVWSDDSESLREGWHQGPPHQRGFRVAVQQEKGRSVPRCQIMQLDALDLGVVPCDRFGGPCPCRYSSAKQQRSS
jgi:hypothetical protein